MAGIVINGNNIKAVSLNGQDVTKISDGVNTLWENTEYSLNYMWMQNTSDEVGTFTLKKTGTPNATELHYSLDKFHWTALDLTQSTNTVSVPAGGRIWFRGDNPNGFCSNSSNYFSLGMDKSHTVGGKLNSLLHKSDFETLTSNYPSGCFTSLFRADSLLTAADELDMGFNQNYSIVNANTFRTFFYQCSNLVSAPDLSNITSVVGEYGMSSFFGSCASLNVYVDLSGLTTNNANNGTSYMFNGCTSLTFAPNMSNITSVKNQAMYQMFNNCTSLTTAPDLSSIVDVGSGAFQQMFRGCSSLNYIKCPNIASWTDTIFSQWVDGVSATGTFVKPSDLTVTTPSASGIPSGWTVENYDTWLCFTDASGSSNTLTLTKTDTGGLAPSVNLEYSTDKVNWTTWTETNNVRTYTIPANGKVYLRGVNPNGLCYNGRNCHTFSSTKNVRASGNIMTIADGIGRRTEITRPFFARLFYQMTTLLTAPNFPSEGMSLGDSSLAGLFNGCSSLTTAPSLTVNSLSEGWSCSLMFNGCTSLTDASNIHLNATNIPTQGYDEMFLNCSALTTPPTITSSPLTLYRQALRQMFNGCSSLTTAPNVNVGTLAENFELVSMFNNCTSLTDVSKVKLNPTKLNTASYKFMFYGCSNLVTPPEIMATDISDTTGDASNGSLANMFYNCTKLASIKVHFTSWNSGAYTKQWTYGTKSTGTFYKPSSLPSTKNTSGNTSNPDYIPYNWTVTNI